MLSARQRGTAALAGAIGLGLVLFGVDQPGFAASGAAGGLTVSVVNYSDWGAGFSDGATVKNTGGSAVTGWNIQFDLDSSEAVTSSTGVTYASSGTHYTLTATGTAATLAPGASVLVHFKGTENAGHYIAPTNVTVAPGGGGGSTSPATPTGLAVSGTTASSISLAWTETDDSDPAVSYRVLEGSAVVASPTATSATVGGLAAASTHTYTVEAVDAAGVASSASSPVTATTGTTGGGGGGAFTQSLIDSAVAAKPFAWAAPTSGVPRPGPARPTSPRRRCCTTSLSSTRPPRAPRPPTAPASRARCSPRSGASSRAATSRTRTAVWRCGARRRSRRPCCC